MSIRNRIKQFVSTPISDPLNRISQLGSFLFSQIRMSNGGVLLGRQDGTGAAQEILVGAGLTLAGGTLSAESGGGGGGGANTANLDADNTFTGNNTFEGLNYFPSGAVIGGVVQFTGDVFGYGHIAGPFAHRVALELDNVNNTSDAAKPVSTAQQTALNAKANLPILASYSPAEDATIQLHDVDITLTDTNGDSYYYLISTEILILASQDSEGRRVYTTNGARNPLVQELYVGIGSEPTTLTVYGAMTDTGWVDGYGYVVLASSQGALSEWSWPNATYATFTIPAVAAIGQLCIVNSKETYIATSIIPPKWMPLEVDSSTLHLVHPNGKHDRIEAAENFNPNPNFEPFTYKLPARSGQVLVTDNLSTNFLSVANGGTGATSKTAARTSLGIGTAQSVQFGAITGTPITNSTGSFTTLAATSLTLATALPILQGGTGATTESVARTNLQLGTGNTVTFAGVNGGAGSFTTLAASGAGSSSTAPVMLTGAIYTGGNGTTSFPHIFYQPTGATPATNWSPLGTAIGINMPAGFAGDFSKYKVAGATVLTISANGGITITGGAGVAAGPSSFSTLAATGLATLSGGVSTTTIAASGEISTGSAGTYGSFILRNATPATRLAMGVNGAGVSAVRLGLSSVLSFGNGLDPIASADDLTISRSAAGIVQIGTSSANALGSLLLTNLTATGLATLSGGVSTTTLAASGAITLGTSGILVGGTNIIEQRNGTASQEFRLFNTYSGGGANSEYLRIFGDSTSFRFSTAQFGTGLTKRLVFDSSASIIQFTFNGGGMARFSTGGFTFDIDNAYDIGASGANRPRDLHIARNLNVTGASTLSGGLILPTSTTPASATAAGVAGTVCWDASYIYVCVATNTWKRTPLATWP